MALDEDEDEGAEPMGQVIQIDEAWVTDHVSVMARGTVEEALSAMVDAEANRPCSAVRCKRKLETRAGGVSLKIPKQLREPFENAIVESYQWAGTLGREGANRYVRHLAFR